MSRTISKHPAAKCNKKDCGVCHPHKRFSKRISKLWNKKRKLEEEKYKI